MIAWHKSYIHLRFDPNPMVFESLSGTFATSDFGLNRIRWYEKNLPGTNSTSDYVFSHIRWCAHSEMIKFNTSIYAFDQIRWYTCQKCSHSLHPITPSAISDGASAQKRSNSLHPFMLSAKSDGPTQMKARCAQASPQLTRLTSHTHFSSCCCSHAGPCRGHRKFVSAASLPARCWQNR